MALTWRFREPVGASPGHEFAGEVVLHRAIFYCCISLIERMEKRTFRRAKGDICFPHDA